MILVSVVESTSIVNYIMVYIPTFILCACKKCEVHEAQKGSCDLWRNIVQSDKSSTKGELWFVKEYCAKWQI
jgi:hypothetical protein